MKPRVSIDELKRRLTYNPETGLSTWNFLIGASTGANARAGHLCGGINSFDGYRHVGINGRLYPHSNIAWAYMTGEWPNGDVDHHNGIRADDKWNNLRAATRSQNCANRKTNTNSILQLKGVRRKGKRFEARIMARGVSVRLGMFDTAAAAHEAYIIAAQERFGEFARAA